MTDDAPSGFPAMSEIPGGEASDRPANIPPKSEVHGYYARVAGNAGDASAGDSRTEGSPPVINYVTGPNVQPPSEQDLQPSTQPPKSEPTAEPAEPAADPRAPWAERSPLVEALPAREYADYTPPAEWGGLQMDRTQMRKLNELVDLARGGDYQGARDQMVGMHLAELRKVAEETMQWQRDVWNRRNEQMISEMRADPEYGGTKLETTLGNAKSVIEQFGGSRAEQNQLLAELDNGGVSNSRRFVALLARIYDHTREPQPVMPNLPGPSGRQGSSRQTNWYGG